MMCCSLIVGWIPASFETGASTLPSEEDAIFTCTNRCPLMFHSSPAADTDIFEPPSSSPAFSTSFFTDSSSSTAILQLYCMDVLLNSHSIHPSALLHASTP